MNVRTATAQGHHLRAYGLALLAAIILFVQVDIGHIVDIPGPPEPHPVASVPPSSSAVPTDQDLHLIWREFRPAQHLIESPAGVVCGAALQRASGRASLIVRFCTDVPITAARRFGLGYESFVVGAELPGGGRLSYSLLDFVSTGPYTGREFKQGTSLENTIVIHDVFIRDATDVVFKLDADVPAGLPVITVHGSFNGAAFVETDAFEPLGPMEEFVQLEMARSVTAPKWAAAPP